VKLRAGLLSALLAAAAVPARAAPSEASVRLELELHSWVQDRAGKDEEGRASRYMHALTDLNGDGMPEGLVYLTGRDRCGSGGCNLYILRRGRGVWRLINSVTIAKLPIRRLTTISRGWSDIGVHVSGGGIVDGYEAVLRFNGRRYPGNPTVAPAWRGRKGAPGQTLMSYGSRERPLFP
jgi:hypothetical protein